MQVLPRSRSCFVCGVDNPLGLNLEFHRDGKLVTARFRPRAEHIGFKQTVHGGLVATVLDEVMVWVCGVQTGRFAYCAELNVRYARPVRPGEEAVATGELVSNRRNKLFEAKATLRDAQQVVLATATGKYLPIPDSLLPDMLADFVGDAGLALKTVLAQQRMAGPE